MRLIDADALEKVLGLGGRCEDCDHVFGKYLCSSGEWREVCDAISEAPTIDAVPVVRCKDCKHSRNDELWHMRWCKGVTVKDEHFCADGERRKDDE